MRRGGVRVLGDLMDERLIKCDLAERARWECITRLQQHDWLLAARSGAILDPMKSPITCDVEPGRRGEASQRIEPPARSQLTRDWPKRAPRLPRAGRTQQKETSGGRGTRFGTLAFHKAAAPAAKTSPRPTRRRQRSPPTRRSTLQPAAFGAGRRTASDARDASPCQWR